MFAVYFPNCQGADPVKHFDAVGLADLLAPDDASPSFTELAPGPDGGRGLAASWQGSVPPIGAGRLAWSKSPRCLPDSSTAAFWLGKSGDSGPEDFARQRLLSGHDVTLADGRAWTIATARQLPQVLRQRSDGAIEGTIIPQYEPYYAACWQFWSTMTKPDGGGKVWVSWSEALKFVGLALSINYRANLDVVCWLGLVRSDRLLDVHKAAIEFDELMELQKKTDGPPSAGSPSTAAGAPA